MKVYKFSNWLFLGVILAFISASAFAEKVPEFDGGYITNMSGNFEEMKAKKASYTQISKGGMSVMALVNQPRTYYVADKTGMISVSLESFKGIAIRGSYKFEDFSLHPLVTKKLTENEGLFENHGPATKDKPFYVVGHKIDIQSKSLGNSTYYFAPRAKLDKGEYAAWIGDTFWIFEVK
jgi:hypothetical protein